jgi:ribosomal-protein-alanine N-acetyltransferase
LYEYLKANGGYGIMFGKEGYLEEFPKLKTKRLVLREITLEDANDIFNYMSKDEVTKYDDSETFTKVKQAESLIKAFSRDFHKNEGIRWGISLDNKIIGSAGFHHWSKENPYRAEIGYELSPEYWKQGYMIEALTKIIEYGFNEFKLKRIHAHINPKNKASRKTAEKVGMNKEGLLKAYYYEKRQFEDDVVYSIINDEW